MHRTAPITLSAPALRQARLHLLEHGDCPPGTVDERLARSWRPEFPPVPARRFRILPAAVKSTWAVS